MSREWTPEEIAALVDGAMVEPDAARMRRAIELDPQAQELAIRIHRLNGLLRGAYDVPADAPTPESIAAVFAAEKGKVVALPDRRRPGVWIPAAVAACLVLAVGLGLYGSYQRSSDDLIAALPDGALALALEHLPSGERSPDGVRPMLTFRDGAGRPCREFEIETAAAEALRLGVACRGVRGDWHVEIVVSAPEAGARGAGYVTASGSAGNELDAVLDDLGAQMPLTPEKEASLLATDWKGED